MESGCSARLREALASSLFERDPVRNLDAAIHEGETAMEIMRPLPADKVFQQTPARLGNYYRMKGDAAGAGENRGWYEKSLRVLLGAREASQAIEQAYPGFLISSRSRHAGKSAGTAR